MTRHELDTRVHEVIGRASLCWSPPPRGEFLAEQALTVAEEFSTECLGLLESELRAERELCALAVDKHRYAVEEALKVQRHRADLEILCTILSNVAEEIRSTVRLVS